jgi:hypothetical protein
MSDKKLELAIELGKRVKHFFSGRIGAEADAFLPQVKRKLIIRAEKIIAFGHTQRCDDIQQLSTSNVVMKFSARDDKSREIPFCTYAPEWAEHARFDRSDDACDDGRAGEA